MRKIEKLGDLTISDYLFMTSLSGDGKVVRRRLVDYFELGDCDADLSAKYLNNINNILESISEDESYLTLKFKYEGVEYGFEPNLRDIKTSVWLDIDINDDPVELMSILYRPIVKKFNWWSKKTYAIEKYKGSHGKFKDLPLDIYIGCTFFFLNLRKTLLELLNIYTLQTQMEAVKQKDLTLAQKQLLMSNITGIISYMSLPVSNS